MLKSEQALYIRTEVGDSFLALNLTDSQHYHFHFYLSTKGRYRRF